MKKLKLNLSGAKALNKAQQRQINGGYGGGSGSRCDSPFDSCDSGLICCGPPGGAQYCQGTSC